MRTIFVCILIIFSSIFQSQTYILSGKISAKNEPLPFATILIKGTSNGTSSNINGQYALKLQAGTYEIVYQYIGYTKKIEKVELNSDKTLNIDLKSDGINLSEIEIKAGEDPAYAIMRKAIKKRKYYLNQIYSYSCSSYIKGLQRINQLPKNISKLVKLSGRNASDTNELKGVVYLSESESKYYFRQKNEEKEIMIGSKVSGDNKAFSFNQLSDMKINFYKNLVELGFLSSRPLVSPLNENAFLFYKFFLLGTINNEGKSVSKIKVVPKRKTDPCFTGIIYIQDSTWRITGIDLMLTKDNKINFVDTLSIKQLHAPVLLDSVWMPVSLNFYFDFKAFGFKGNGYFNGIIKDYELNPFVPKNFFKSEVLKVEEAANKKDTTYWSSNRPVPLTKEEEKDYQQKDSLEKVQNTDRYKDSVDKTNNKYKLIKFFSGYTYQNTRKNLQFSLPGILANGVQYNTVEGLNLSYKFNISRSYDDYRSLMISGRSRYGFSNKLWGGMAGFTYLFKPEKFSRFGFDIQSIAMQYNRDEPISPLVNSLYTLLLKNNYMKLFKETAVESSYFSELTNGLYLSSVIKYAIRDPLKNTSNYLFIDDKNKLFTSNNPQNPASESAAFKTNNALTAEVSFTIRFKQKYYTLPHRKVISGSKYPRVWISYKKAIPISKTDADYDLASLNINDNVKLGLFGTFKFRLKGGAYLNNRKLYFMDYKHFNGNQTIYTFTDYLGIFRLLPYYAFSADQWYTEAHAEHHFNGFIINKIPLVKKLKIQEVVGGHFLANNRLRSYYEVNFGLDRIFNIIRLDYVLGYSADSKVKQGFTFSLNMNF